MPSVRYRLTLALACLLAAVGAGCGLSGLVRTEIEIKGERQSLEEQVLGSFEHIGEKVYLLAGVRAVDPLSGEVKPPPPMTDSESAALAARRRMEFNRDDILRFKRLGYAGEGSDGQLVLFEEEMDRLRREEPRRHELVRAIVEEENRDRLTIMQRIVRTSPPLRGKEGLRTVRSILAARHRRQAEDGTRIQMPDGTWRQKGGGAP